MKRQILQPGRISSSLVINCLDNIGISQATYLRGDYGQLFFLEAVDGPQLLNRHLHPFLATKCPFFLLARTGAWEYMGIV